MESTNPSWANLQAGRPEQCTTAGERPDRDNLHPPHPHPFLFTHPPFLFPTPFFFWTGCSDWHSVTILYAKTGQTRMHCLLQRRWVTLVARRHPLCTDCQWLQMPEKEGNLKGIGITVKYLSTMYFAVPPGISLLLLQLCKIERTHQ